MDITNSLTFADGYTHVVGFLDKALNHSMARAQDLASLGEIDQGIALTEYDR